MAAEFFLGGQVADSGLPRGEYIPPGKVLGD
jgi:hypothetical protein